MDDRYQYTVKDKVNVTNFEPFSQILHSASRALLVFFLSYGLLFCIAWMCALPPKLTQPPNSNPQPISTAMSGESWGTERAYQSAAVVDSPTVHTFWFWVECGLLDYPLSIGSCPHQNSKIVDCRTVYRCGYTLCQMYQVRIARYTYVWFHHVQHRTGAQSDSGEWILTFEFSHLYGKWFSCNHYYSLYYLAEVHWLYRKFSLLDWLRMEMVHLETGGSHRDTILALCVGQLFASSQCPMELWNVKLSCDHLGLQMK